MPAPHRAAMAQLADSKTGVERDLRARFPAS